MDTVLANLQVVQRANWKQSRLRVAGYVTLNDFPLSSNFQMKVAVVFVVMVGRQMYRYIQGIISSSIHWVDSGSG